jgi:ubiquinol-cytochrome c reductase cytochrome b subunit
LRAVPNKLIGAIILVSAVLCFVILPWLDKCKVKSIRYRGWQYKLALYLFAISFLVLGYLGMMPATGIYVMLARVFTIIYFAFFLLMPFYTRFENTKPVPTRVIYKK